MIRRELETGGWKRERNSIFGVFSLGVECLLMEVVVVR
jgi:hypothetical protein